MKLILFRDDVFVASELAAVTRDEEVVTITLRGGADFEYEFDDEEQAAKAVLRAVQELQP